MIMTCTNQNNKHFCLSAGNLQFCR